MGRGQSTMALATSSVLKAHRSSMDPPPAHQGRHLGPALFGHQVQGGRDLRRRFNALY